MNYVDLAIIIILGLIGFKGFRRGLISEVLALVGLFLAIYGGSKLSVWSSEVLSQYVDIAPLALTIISFTVLFISIILLIQFLGKLITKMIKIAALGIINRILGTLFALLKGLLICGLLAYALVAINQRITIISDAYLSDSLLFQPLVDIIEMLTSFVSEESGVEI